MKLRELFKKWKEEYRLHKLAYRILICNSIEFRRLILIEMLLLGNAVGILSTMIAIDHIYGLPDPLRLEIGLIGSFIGIIGIWIDTKTRDMEWDLIMKLLGEKKDEK